MSPDPWKLLAPGDRFAIDSLSGNSYEVTFLARAPHPAGGIFLRFADNTLARFHPERLNWSTLERLLPAEAFVPGDELLLTTREGVECRGRIVEASADQLSLKLFGAGVIEVALDGNVARSIRIALAATDWQIGDDFLVQSRSGRAYRGTTVAAYPDRILASLQGPNGFPGGEPVSLRVERLDLASLRILIPVRTGSLAPA